MAKKRPFAKIALGLLLIYAAGLFLLVTYQRVFLYFPEPFHTLPEKAGAPSQIREITVTTRDGLQLTGWYAPPTGKKQVLVFFHGNADSLRSMAKIPAPYLAAGYGFLQVEYRGWSGNPGKPTEQGLYNDGRAYIDWLVASGVTPGEIVFYGHSLGSGVAVQMAGEYPPAGVILEAPFLSIAKMAQLRFPYFPAELLAEDRFESFKKITLFHAPLFVAHGDRDVVVPMSQGKALFDLAAEPKTLFIAPGGGHGNLAAYGFVEASLGWLANLK